MEKDLFGKALVDYLNGNHSEDIITSTNISEDDVLPLPYLFRSFKEMPELEQKALKNYYLKKELAKLVHRIVNGIGYKKTFPKYTLYFEFMRVFSF